MDEKDLEALIANRKELEDLMRQKDFDLKEVDASSEKLEKLLRKCGGKIYPRTFWIENVEMLLVASILAISIRSFFIQPFQIPTNSMWPTYSGMQFELFTEETPRPGLIQEGIRKLRFWCKRYQIRASNDGELLIPVFSPNDRKGGPGLVRYSVVRGKKWGFLNEIQRQYTFYLDGQPINIRVPVDFSLDDIVQKRWFSSSSPFFHTYKEQFESGDVIWDPKLGTLIKADARVRKGDSVLDFDILSGDMLFVDRFSYHFIKPKVGDPIVFRTKDIPGLMGPDGRVSDKYYIKRLVGISGDVLEVKPPTLYRNGEPISGSIAFDKNSDQEGLYPGYTAQKRLALGEQEIIPEGFYYAMGDNSPFSEDSRMFGFVPEKALVGKALFIYYPFGERWGLGK